MGAAMQGGGGRASRRRGRRAGPMAEINVTPMVDVMVVLLIIFMVAAPLLTVGVPLQLPQTSASSLPQEQEEPLTISLDPSGRIFLQKTEVAEAELIPKLSAIRATRESDKVYLRADGRLEYARVARVMAALQRGGFRNVALVMDQAPEGGAETEAN